jgi:hypothetical protein
MVWIEKPAIFFDCGLFHFFACTSLIPVFQKLLVVLAFRIGSDTALPSRGSTADFDQVSLFEIEASSSPVRVPAYRRRALRAAPRAPCRVAAMRLRSLTPPAAGMPPACALRLPVSRLQVWWGWLADPFILAHRSRCQGLRALHALAAGRPSSNL